MLCVPSCCKAAVQYDTYTGIIHLFDTVLYCTYVQYGTATRFDADVFTPKKADTINDLKREFKKFAKTKKGNKQLIARITDAVAA